MARGVLYSLKFGPVASWRRAPRLPFNPGLMSFFDIFQCLGDVVHFRCFCSSPCLELFIHVQLQLSGSPFPPRASDPVSHDNQPLHIHWHDRPVASNKLRMRGILLRCVPRKPWKDKLIDHSL